MTDLLASLPPIFRSQLHRIQNKNKYPQSRYITVEATADMSKQLRIFLFFFFLKTALIIQVIVHYKRKSVKPDAEYLEQDNRSIQQVSASSNNSLLPHRRYRMLLRS